MAKAIVDNLSFSIPSIHINIPGTSPSNNFYLIDGVYKEKIRDPKAIMPFEKDAFPKFPSATNIISLPSETYKAALTLIHSLQTGDHEEVHDAAASLLAVPANLGSAIGNMIEYGLNFAVLSSHISPFLRISYILGAAFCALEGLIDGLSLFRQTSFNKKFEFKLLNHLKILIENPNPIQSYNAFIHVLSMLKSKESEMPGSKPLFAFLENLKTKLEERPHFRCFTIEDSKEELKALAQAFLFRNLLEIQREYLQLNPEEVEKICKHAMKNAVNERSYQQQELVMNALEKGLNSKRKKLSRRVRPWMTHELSFNMESLMSALFSPSPEVRGLALREGLSLANDMRIQTAKKTLVHAIGILAFAFAAASLLAILIGFPLAIPFALIMLATAIATLRFFMAAGTLDLRGWDFSVKDLLPNFIRKRIFQDLPLSHPEILRQKAIIQIPFLQHA